MPTKSLHAEPITRRDIVRLVAVGGSTASEEPASEAPDSRRTPTVRPPSMRAPEPSIPPGRKSAVRLKDPDANALPYAVVDVVTADFSKDPRHED
jgi:hypothetical protein